MKLNPFAREGATHVIDTQLFEAERLHLEHAASAEHHKALADMYAARVARLKGNGLKAAPPVLVPQSVPSVAAAK